MGRTKRKRLRKNNTKTFDSDPDIINLKRWMSDNKWTNETFLKIVDFPDTGRGITSSKNIKKSDVLIEIPYNLMITFTTLQDIRQFFLNPSIQKLTIQDLLSIYLVLERHQGSHSKWQHYINSLPKSPPLLPWLCTSQELELIELSELKNDIEKCKWKFESSWERARRSINKDWKCPFCEKHADCVLTLDLFTWSYAMVNTRAVYVDPNVVREITASQDFLSILSDEPSMALCPFLDMFNHSHETKTEALLENVKGFWKFKLIAMTCARKYQQIFISYGDHDNVKLLCEYGFFTAQNSVDSINFNLRELMKNCKLEINKRQFKFIRDHSLNKNLNLFSSGLSFHLKAVLFVILKGCYDNWTSIIYNEGYPENCVAEMKTIVKEMLKKIADKAEFEVNSLGSYLGGKCFDVIVAYLKYRVDFVKELIEILN